MISVTFAMSALANCNVRAAGRLLDFSAVSTDSRSIKPGELFLALRGERFDGHAFVREVLAAGAVAAIVDAAWAQENDTSGLNLFIVDDTRRAFAALASAWRRQFAIPLIGVVGSNGKTTVKEMIASILGAELGVEHRLATSGNLNNDIGVPIMLLRLDAPHQAAVIEMGMNHPGETALLASIVEPTVAIINNAQREHQEFMKNVAAVAEEHAAILGVLPADGVAVLNIDDEFYGYWSRQAAPRRIMSFGLDPAASVHALAIDVAKGAGTEFELVTPAGRAPLHLATVGLHNVSNALGAAAAALAAGCSLAGVVAGLEAFRPVKGRLQQYVGAQGSCIIDDSYNANPDSVRAAIDVLASRPGQRVLVLGDMGEVGERAAEYHAEIGSYARERGIDVLLALGDMTKATVQSFGDCAVQCVDVDDLLQRLRPALNGATSVLVKGSRFMRMERVVELLRQTDSPSDPTVKPEEGKQHAA